MKKFTFTGIALAMILLFGVAVCAQEPPGTWYECFTAEDASGNYTAPGDGNIGNTLFAEGIDGSTSWRFYNAAIALAPDPDEFLCYNTVYIGGTFEYGNWTASDVVGYNYSCSSSALEEYGDRENQIPCDLWGDTAGHFFEFAFSGYFDGNACSDFLESYPDGDLSEVVRYEAYANFCGDPVIATDRDCGVGNFPVSAGGDLTTAAIVVTQVDSVKMADIFTECLNSEPRNHGAFVKCVSKKTNKIKKKKPGPKVITGAQKGIIVSCAAQSDYGKP